MQNKGLIRLFAILFGLVCVYQLSFTWFAKNVEENAANYAKGKRAYLDSVANKPVVNLGIASFTYNEVKGKEINLGLDLKGGINATLEVSVKDILVGLSNHSKNPIFNKALEEATKAQKGSNSDYITLFFDAFEKLSNGGIKLSDPKIFGNKSLRDKINFKMSDVEVQPILRSEVNGSINTAFEVLRSRIDKFGVTQPNIQRVAQSGRILIELPGAKDIDRVKKLLQSTAELQFWEVYTNQETALFFQQADAKLATLLKTEDNTKAKKDSKIDDLLGEVKDSVDNSKLHPFFTVFYPSIPQTENQKSSRVGTAALTDTATVNKYLAMPEVRALLKDNMRYTKFLWDAKPITDSEVIYLYAIKSNREDKAPIEGDVIEDARQAFDQFGANPEVSMTMNSKGSKLWGKMTTANVGNFVAVVLDNYVYTAPRVNDAITSGRTSISGNFTITEAQDLANVLKAGKLPAPAQIIQSEIVGPSLGQEAIDSGVNSFLIALALILLWMILYYGKAGVFADVALVTNILYIFGVLTGFGAVLTLPGIAGIVLTIGMSVDANVLIYERIKEEFIKGKGTKEAIRDGFGGALSSIIDANVTTFLTGLILFIFGSGPIKGFATTLMIGIMTSLFSAIFITRLFIEWYMKKDRTLTFDTKITRNWFKDLDIAFLRKRKIAFFISGAIILGGLVSLFTNGLNYGVDFKGGRTYTVRFEKAVSPTEVGSALKVVFGSAPEVKTFGGDNQLKITTKYNVDKNGLKADDEVQQKLFDGIKAFLPDGMTMNQFKPGGETAHKIGVMQAVKVGPTIADDIKKDAFWAILGSLIVVFLYILLRFRKWQFSLGAVVAVFHDVLVVLGTFSLLYKYLPFDLEIDQAFIAAILTVVGYSLNDTVVIFDRIREFANLHHSWDQETRINKALSSTLSRTINTSLTTLLVLLAIFIDGGETIRGFMFALIIGVIVGTYSSLFIASPIMYMTTKKLDKKQ
ncbi:MAG: protein translocase subunit SecDF [Flavobacteriaceae bacterium]